jgi:hypothetical protein
MRNDLRLRRLALPHCGGEALSVFLNFGRVLPLFLAYAKGKRP